MDYDERPRLVFWEMTKACPLACVHCRATAQRKRSRVELSTNEGMRLIDELAATGKPHPVLILTGGDCLARDDLVGLAAYAKHAGVPVAIAPSVSPHLCPEILRQLRKQGVTRASLSLDGSSAATHDGIRGVADHFDATLDAITLLQDQRMHVQINTAVMARNAEEMADVAALLYWNNVRVWEVFFLVTVGRGTSIHEVDAAAARDICHFLVDASQYGMVVRTVEAPFFRRVQQERAAVHPRRVAETFGCGPLYRHLTKRLVEQLGEPKTRTLAPTTATRDGKGVIFVAHNGDVYPSGFFPLSLGNVRQSELLDIYRNHLLLRAMRRGKFPGNCGACGYSDLCGGSRARAYAATGDALADDPACHYVKLAAAS